MHPTETLAGTPIQLPQQQLPAATGAAPDWPVFNYSRTTGGSTTTDYWTTGGTTGKLLAYFNIITKSGGMG